MSKNNLRKKLFPMNGEVIKYIGLLSQLGLTFISSLLIIFFLFLFLDRKLQTGGILLIPGLILGIVAGGVAVYRLITRFYRLEEDEENAEK